MFAYVYIKVLIVVGDTQGNQATLYPFTNAMSRQ